MHIAFRVDSSTIIGHGHVMRCLTLARALTHLQKHIKVNISFITKANQGNINHLINQANYQLVLLPIGNQLIEQKNSDTWLGCTPEHDAEQCITAIKKIAPIDLFIVDHYAIAKSWHQRVKPYYQKLMVIDDLANRLLDCDFLLDQTLNCHKEHYQSLVPEHCQLLLGQDYMLLRDEFLALRAQAKSHREQQSTQLTQANILITMGGGDPDNLSELALLAIEKLHTYLPNVSATLVLSSQSKHIKLLLQRQKKSPWCQLVIDSKNMAQLMLSADIAIGASGATAWERCCLGLPSLMTINAVNQQVIAKNLADTDASINLGWHKNITSDMITTQLKRILASPSSYLTMVKHCFSACDGRGASKVAQSLIAKVTNHE
ncbi:MAG: UDP-2,4-diacetamido-2,4,6-trideoxy-beta-L-altropyranose hydrolase [Colwellia sp.]|nr:UDP-2,4-diacetamido-2,4,6-trideoxy-beta-L-altropyranose hydrolase [Colwellia sp.]